MVVFPDGYFYVGQRQSHDPYNDNGYWGSGTYCGVFNEVYQTEKCTKFILMVIPYCVIWINLWENVWIGRYKKLLPEYCLNILDGPAIGIFSCHPCHIPEIAEKHRQAILDSYKNPEVKRKNEEILKEARKKIVYKKETYEKVSKKLIGRPNKYKNSFCINDGTNNRFILIGTPIPEGFVEGMLLSEEAKQKMSEASKNREISDEQRLAIVERLKIFHPMRGRHHSEQTKKLISEKKLAQGEEISKRMIGNKNGVGTRSRTGYIWINNGEVNLSIHKDSPIPDGYTNGRLMLWLKGNKYAAGYIWITNSVDSKHLSKNDKIPKGWRRGRTF
jgi:hypothetical protein